MMHPLFKNLRRSMKKIVSIVNKEMNERDLKERFRQLKDTIKNKLLAVMRSVSQPEPEPNRHVVVNPYTQYSAETLEFASMPTESP